MPKNTIVGKKKPWLRNKATWRDYSYTKKYNSRPEEIAKRVELNKEARKRKIYGKRTAMWKDLSHTKSGKLVLENKKTNRARNGANGRSTKK